MAAIDDTPTPHMLITSTDAYTKVSEQGVLSIDNGCANNGLREEKMHSSKVRDSVNGIKPSQNILLAATVIKSEPPLDIYDSNTLDEDNKRASPQIRLTPTSKLLAPQSSSTPDPLLLKKKYACPYENCTKSYGKSSHLRSHLTWHTGIKPFVCQELGCGKGFTRSDELNRHVRTHTGEKPFECMQCTKRFSRSDHLSKHLATHAKQMTNGNTRKPRTNKQAIAIGPAPTKIIKVESDDIKMDCNDGIHFMASMVENRQTASPENLTDEAILPIETVKIKLEKPDYSEHQYHMVNAISMPAYSGDNAENEDNKPDLLNQGYQEQEHFEAPLSPSLLVPEVKMEPGIKIEPEVYIKNEIMYDHNDDNEGEEPDDNAIMPEANLPPFNNVNPQYSLLHTTSVDSVYDPERPYKCTVCSKYFKRQDDLNRHMRVHTGEKPFKCNECDKGFKRSDHLKKHLNTHIRLR
ncbi:uncharacterized protein ACN427_001196 [Glossina fuscipes fuscipes]|uniref:Wilms tumor protein homolog n=1 Tax=Glossina palpalis gambiensis TaxID=67801 RepID=A0A1B0AMA5_9MUSC